MRNELGNHFFKFLQTLNPLTIHQCKECIFTDHCTHDCCLQLVKYHYNKQISLRDVSSAVVEPNSIVQIENNICLGKRGRDIFLFNNNHF